VPGLRKRVMIEQERLTKVAEELANSIPAHIQEAREIVKQRESIVSQAQLEARRVREAAEQESAAMTAESHQEHIARVGETEVLKTAELKAEEVNQEALREGQDALQDAQRRSYRMLDEAEAVAGTRREGANQYARETLFDLEERLASLLAQVRKGIDALGLEVEEAVGNGASPRTHRPIVTAPASEGPMAVHG
jgi:hypothetical protein